MRNNKPKPEMYKNVTFVDKDVLRWYKFCCFVLAILLFFILCVKAELFSKPIQNPNIEQKIVYDTMVKFDTVYIRDTIYIRKPIVKDTLIIEPIAQEKDTQNNE